MDFSEKQTHHQQLYKQQLQWFESTGEQAKRMLKKNVCLHCLHCILTNWKRFQVTFTFTEKG